MKKTVLITGGARGIGAACAELFSEKGYNVVVNYAKSYEKAHALVEKIGAMAICCDVSDGESVNKMTEEINARYGGVDVLVNNAGIGQIKMFTDISEEEWDRMFDVNVKGVYNCTKAVLPYMIQKKSGKIINVSSMWGITGASCEVHYSASKAAVIGFTKALAKELAPSGINVNCVAPGVVNTDMCNDLTEEDIHALEEETPLGRIGTSEDIAKTVLFLAEDSADFITGHVLSVNGGMVI